MPRPASAIGPDTIFLNIFIDKNLSFRFSSEFLFRLSGSPISSATELWEVRGGEGWRGSIHSLLPYLKPRERMEADIQLNDFSMGPTGRWLAPLTFEFSLGSSKDP